ncbi:MULTISPECIES: hypothetical protein [unclassified Microcoleus]|uniref:hypothetical protein n=1 Tax=unclassified Microcoleus TaxID=2642155 RepID=UPI002FCEFEC3
MEQLTGDVAKIWCCSLGGELTSIDEVGRGKTNLACLYCGGSLIAKKGNVRRSNFSGVADHKRKDNPDPHFFVETLIALERFDSEAGKHNKVGCINS